MAIETLNPIVKLKVIYRLLILMLIFLSSIFYSYSQKQPRWIESKPNGKTGKFIYEIGIGIHSNLDTAQRKAFYDMVRKVSSTEGETIDVESLSISDTRSEVTGDNEKFVENFGYTGTVRTKSKKFTKYIQEIEFYRTEDEYIALYRIADYQEYLSKPKFVYTEYNKAISFIPGAAQFKKQERGKGFMIITGEVLLLGGVVISNAMYNSFHNEYANYLKNGDLRNADISKSNRDMAGIVFSGCVIGAASLYLYNIIDGFLTDGKPQYAQKKLKLYPRLAYKGTGLTVTYNFN